MVHPAVRLRVHFAAVGLQIRRVVEPARDLQADVVLLVTFSLTDRLRHELGKIKQLLEESTPKIRTHVVSCDIWNAGAVVDEVGAIVTSAPQHEYFYNVSSGAKTACIAGTIAGMFWNVKPYYVAVDYDGKTVHGEEDYPVHGPPQFIPTFEIPLLDRASVTALQYLCSRGGPVSKRDLIRHLSDQGLLGPRQSTIASPQALQAQANTVLGHLDSWGFISSEGRGKQLRISASERGVWGNRMFQHQLTKRPRLGILG